MKLNHSMCLATATHTKVVIWDIGRKHILDKGWRGQDVACSQVCRGCGGFTEAASRKGSSGSLSGGGLRHETWRGHSGR